MKGKLIIVSGPSGSGKSTVTKIVKDKLNIPLSISDYEIGRASCRERV